MRILIAVIVIAALAWGGYWFVGASAVERGLTAWLEARRADGWTVAYDGLNTSGFPNRFDTTVTGLTLADPQSGLGWSGEIAQILALSYKPNHVIAALPHLQSITTPYDDIAVTSDRMRGSVVFAPNTSLALDHSAFIAETVTVTGQSGWSVSLDEGRLATRRAVARENAHDIGLELLGFAPTSDLRSRLDPEGTLPAALETLKIDATAAFDAPWDRSALGADRPELTALDVTSARMIWGDMTLDASGALTVDEAGTPTGLLTVTATQWRGMLDMAVAAGLVQDGLKDTVEKGLTLLSGGSDSVTMPLNFAKGLVSLGPVPLGPAPRLR